MLELKNSLRQSLESYVRDCVKSGIHYKDALQQLEMEYVMQVLGQTAYNVSKAAHVLVYDAAEIGDVHPLLTPLVLNPAPQPVILQSTIMRGILDLTPRVYMGRGLLGSPDSPWP